MGPGPIPGRRSGFRRFGRSAVPISPGGQRRTVQQPQPVADDHQRPKLPFLAASDEWLHPQAPRQQWLRMRPGGGPAHERAVEERRETDAHVAAWQAQRETATGTRRQAWCRTPETSGQGRLRELPAGPGQPSRNSCARRCGPLRLSHAPVADRHTGPRLPDYDAGIAFFTGIGFDLVEDSGRGGGKRRVVLRPSSGGSDILLARAVGAQTAAIGQQAGGRVGVFLTTTDFSRDAARVIEAGGVFEEDARREDYGLVAVFRDPFGNRWDLIQPAG